MLYYRKVFGRRRITMLVNHTLEPIYDEHSKVLILGTMPSLKSRELNFYYAHPKNRFWPVLSRVYGEEIPHDIVAKKEFLHRHHLALFDVLKSCDIANSQDSSIRNPVPNDLGPILASSQITHIFTTGKKAYELYQKLIYPHTHIAAYYLPSTSPANSPRGIEEKLLREYQKIKDITDNIDNF